jgi:hypothetical protein
MMDKNIDDEREWDVVEISEHRTCRTVRRVPGQYDDEFLVRQKHVRVKAHFHNGETQWAQMEAVKLQDTFPLLQYIFRMHLEDKKFFEWAKGMVDETDHFEQLARVFKAKVERGPIIKFGVEVPKNPIHAIRLDRKNGNRLWQDATAVELHQINEYETFRLPKPGEDLLQHEHIPYHIVYDCKFDGRRKS